jgi:hypothetical protein
LELRDAAEDGCKVLAVLSSTFGSQIGFMASFKMDILGNPMFSVSAVKRYSTARMKRQCFTKEKQNCSDVAGNA